MMQPEDQEHLDLIAESAQFDEQSRMALAACYFLYRHSGYGPNAALLLMYRDLRRAETRYYQPKIKKFRHP